MYEGPGQEKVHMLIIVEGERERVKFAHVRLRYVGTNTQHKQNKQKISIYVSMGGHQDLKEYFP